MRISFYVKLLDFRLPAYGIYLVLHDRRLLSFGIRDGPLLVVASGWDTISATSSIKRLAPEKVFAIQV